MVSRNPAGVLIGQIFGMGDRRVYLLQLQFVTPFMPWYAGSGSKKGVGQRLKFDFREIAIPLGLTPVPKLNRHELLAPNNST